MNIKYILAIMLVLVLLIGCGKSEEKIDEEEIEEEITDEQEVEEEKDDELPPMPEEELEEEEEPKVLPEEIKEIIEKGKKRLKSYEYDYLQPDDTTNYNILVLGDKIKIVYPGLIKIKSTEYYDTMFLDTKEETAEAYCISESNCDEDIGKKMENMDFDNVYLKLSVEWLDEIEWAEVIDERIIEGRDSLLLDTNIGEVILETYYAWIYQIENEDNMWKFTGTKFNHLVEEDVMP